MSGPDLCMRRSAASDGPNLTGKVGVIHDRVHHEQQQRDLPAMVGTMKPHERTGCNRSMQ